MEAVAAIQEQDADEKGMGEDVVVQVPPQPLERTATMSSALEPWTLPVGTRPMQLPPLSHCSV